MKQMFILLCILAILALIYVLLVDDSKVLDSLKGIQGAYYF